MDVFLALFFRIIPLYLVILLGFVAGKYLNVKKEALASLLIYIIAPVVIFNGVITTKISISTLSLPILFFILASLTGMIFYKLAKFIWTDTTKNIFGFAAGSGNTGYFGLPVAYAIFPSELIGPVVLSILGFILFENSLGFFITARGHHTVKESIIKVLKLPTIYAFFLGLIINLSGIPLGQIYTDTVANFRGAYTVLGMMIIGLGLADVRGFKFDLKFTGLTFLTKFIWWPLMVYGVIIADNMVFRIYNPSIHKVMILMSIVPLAANTVAFATELKAQPEKASVAVLLSTLFALFYIPLIASLFLS